jgi:hypothetical protein
MFQITASATIRTMQMMVRRPIRFIFQANISAPAGVNFSNHCRLIVCVGTHGRKI